MKRVVSVVALIAMVSWMALSGTTFAADGGKDLNYEVLKNNTSDTSIANDYFEKPAKVVEKGGKKYIQITVNHSHWITNFTFDGAKEANVSEDKGKDMRTAEFPLNQESGEIKGTIKVDIDEEVNGKPFSYHHDYKITYKLGGAASPATKSDTPTGTDGGASASSTDKASGGPGSANPDKPGEKVENPQTAAGTSPFLYIVPSIALVLLISSVVYSRRVKQGRE